MGVKDLLFSLIPGKDLIFSTTKGSGPGGQHRNKTETAVRLEHHASGTAVKVSNERSQHQNKIQALHRLASHSNFKAWVRVQAAAIMQGFRNIEDKVDKMLHPRNIKVEYITAFNCDKCGRQAKTISEKEIVVEVPKGWVVACGKDNEVQHYCFSCKPRDRTLPNG